jgi:hypothetical protein
VAASHREDVEGEQTAREAVVGRRFGAGLRRVVLRCQVSMVGVGVVAADARCFGAGLERLVLRCRVFVAGIEMLAVGERCFGAPRRTPVSRRPRSTACVSAQAESHGRQGAGRWPAALRCRQSVPGGGTRVLGEPRFGVVRYTGVSKLGGCSSCFGVGGRQLAPGCFSLALGASVLVAGKGYRGLVVGGRGFGSGC